MIDKLISRLAKEKVKRDEAKYAKESDFDYDPGLALDEHIRNSGPERS